MSRRTITFKSQGAPPSQQWWVRIGRAVVLYLPLLLLLTPLVALFPDQGHEAVENVVDGSPGAYLALVLAPLAFTAVLHSVQMLYRSNQIERHGHVGIDTTSVWHQCIQLLVTLAGLAILASPIYSFSLDNRICVKQVSGFSPHDFCHPGSPLVRFAGVCLIVTLFPRLLHLCGLSKTRTKFWRYAPSVLQLLVVGISTAFVWKEIRRADYGPLLGGAIAPLFMARLPKTDSRANLPADKTLSASIPTVLSDASLSLGVAAFTLLAFAFSARALGTLLGSLFVLYAGVLSWLVIVSFLWSAFLLLQHKRAIVGLGAVLVGVLVLIGLLRGSFDVVSTVNVAKPTQSSPSIKRADNARLADDFREWSSSTGDAGSPRKVVIVLAEGGGIRAAQWTNQMLFALNAGSSDVLKNTYAIVGVSGGALGSTGYLSNLAALYDYQLSHNGGSKVPGEPTFVALRNTEDALGGDLLAPWLARFVSVGAIQPLLPNRSSPSATLEALWNTNLTCAAQEIPPYLIPEYREVCNRMPAIVNGSMRDFPKSVGSRVLPRLFYTATHIETGRRVVESSVSFSPSDFPGAFDVNSAIGGDISLLDATYSSARFPGISRSGALMNVDGHARGHVVDGGYLDGTGALTAADIVDAITRASSDPVIPIILDLDSNPDDDRPLADVPDPSPSLGAGVTQASGIFKGVKQANGVRDLAAVSSLRRQVCNQGGGLLTLQVRKEAAPLPLGWTLSLNASIRIGQEANSLRKTLWQADAQGHPQISLEHVFALAKAKCPPTRKQSS